MNSFADGSGRTEQDIFMDHVSDEALERAGGTGRQDMANPTVPSALICLPFEADHR